PHLHAVHLFGDVGDADLPTVVLLADVAAANLGDAAELLGVASEPDLKPADEVCAEVGDARLHRALEDLRAVAEAELGDAVEARGVFGQVVFVDLTLGVEATYLDQAFEVPLGVIEHPELHQAEERLVCAVVATDLKPAVEIFRAVI